MMWVEKCMWRGQQCTYEKIDILGNDQNNWWLVSEITMIIVLWIGMIMKMNWIIHHVTWHVNNILLELPIILLWYNSWIPTYTCHHMMILIPYQLLKELSWNTFQPRVYWQASHYCEPLSHTTVQVPMQLRVYDKQATMVSHFLMPQFWSLCNLGYLSDH